MINRRIGHKGIGFAAAIEAKPTSDPGEIFEHCLPEDLIQYGLIPEFIGRLPVMSAVHQLTRDDLVSILTEPRNALVKQFQRFFSFDGIELVFAEESLAPSPRGPGAETGARGLRSIIEEILLEVQFELPSRRDVKKCVVTKETVEKGLTPTLVTEAAPEEQDQATLQEKSVRGAPGRAELESLGAAEDAWSCLHVRRPGRPPLAHRKIPDRRDQNREVPQVIAIRIAAKPLVGGTPAGKASTSSSPRRMFRVSASTRRSVAASATKGTSSSTPFRRALSSIRMAPSAARLAASEAKQTSRSNVLRAPPCSTAAMPPMTTKSTPRAVRRRRMPSASSGRASRTGWPGHQPVQISLRGGEAREALGRGHDQARRDLGLVDGHRLGHRSEIQTAARARRTRPEGCHRRIRRRSFQTRYRALGHAEAFAEGGLREPGVQVKDWSGWRRGSSRKHIT